MRVSSYNLMLWDCSVITRVLHWVLYSLNNSHMCTCSNWESWGTQSEEKQSPWHYFWYFCGQLRFDNSRSQWESVRRKAYGFSGQLQNVEILDIGNNQIYDSFPCSLHIISRLRVLVLRSNKFYGTIGCAGTNSTWPVLQIIDLAGNNFTGNLPHEKFLTWKAMMANALLKLNHLQFESEQYRQLYYQNAITVTGKGREMQLVKILTIFTSIDFSCNNFHGSIPKEIGKLQVLYTQLVT